MVFNPPPDDDFILPDDALINQQLEDAEHQQQVANAVLPKFVKHPPPKGAASWKKAPVGSSNMVWLWLCPAAAAGKPLGWLFHSHFVYTKTKPQGLRVPCAGESCRLCEHYYELRYQAPEALKKKVEQLRQRKEYLYNCINLSHDSDQTINAGKPNEMRKNAIVSFGADAHRDVLRILQIQGAVITHPARGTPLAYSRTKTGSEDMNYRYNLNVGKPQPLARQYFDLCRPGNLWALDEIYPVPAEHEQLSILVGMGILKSTAHGRPAASAPQEPAQNFPEPVSPWSAAAGPTYQEVAAATLPPQPPPARGGAPAWAEEAASLDEPPFPTDSSYFGEPPPSKYPPRAPARAPIERGAPPPDAAPARPASRKTPRQAAAAGAPVPGFPPQKPGDKCYVLDEESGAWFVGSLVERNHYPDPAGRPVMWWKMEIIDAEGECYDLESTVEGLRPLTTPPSPPAPPTAPATSTPRDSAAPAPQRAAYSAPPPPPPAYAGAKPQAAAPPPRYAPVAPNTGRAQPSAATKRLSVPLDADVRLPDGRERCFGQHDEEMTLCQTCPDDIKPQCQEQTPGYEPQGDDDPELLALQNQIRQDPRK